MQTHETKELLHCAVFALHAIGQRGVECYFKRTQNRTEM